MPAQVQNPQTNSVFNGAGIYQIPQITVSRVAPTSADRGAIGQLWIQTVDTSGTLVNDAWILTGIVAGVSYWTSIVGGGGSGVFTSVTATTGDITATLGNLQASDGDLVLGTAGNKLRIATGANASVGTATLVAGTVTVSTTAITTNSKVFLTCAAVGGAQGMLSVDNIVNGVSFDIVSSDVADTSDVNWLIVN